MAGLMVKYGWKREEEEKEEEEKQKKKVREKIRERSDKEIFSFCALP